MDIVIDSSVLVDATVTDFPRHKEAAAAIELVRRKGWPVWIPFTVMVELSSVLSREKKVRGKAAPIWGGLGTDEKRFSAQGIPIDKTFMEQYFDTTLPYVKGGDYLFLAIAKKKAALLLTDDKKLQGAAHDCGLISMGVQEFVAKYS